MSEVYMAKRNCCRKKLKKANVDIAVIPETNKEIKGFARVGQLYFIVQWCANE